MKSLEMKKKIYHLKLFYFFIKDPDLLIRIRIRNTVC